MGRLKKSALAREETESAATGEGIKKTRVQVKALNWETGGQGRVCPEALHSATALPGTLTRSS